MLLEVAACAVLIAGGVGSGVAVLARGRDRVTAAAFAVALACAAVAMMTDAAGWTIVACAVATAGVVRLVLERSASVTQLSWLDAVIGSSAAAALALTLDADAVLVV